MSIIQKYPGASRIQDSLQRADGNEMKRKRAMKRTEFLEKVLKFDVTGY